MKLTGPTSRVLVGECWDLLCDQPSNSVDAIVTDPPYELNFMGKKWDGTGIAYNVAMWAEALRVLKPGGYLLAFGGSRTSHRMATAIEDAGFEIRDSLMWLYGSGFPKSLNVSKALDREAGAQRKIIGVRKHPTLTDMSKVKRQQSTQFHATNPTNDEWDITAPETDAAKRWDGWGTALKPAYEPIVMARKPLTGSVAANVLTYGTGAINIDGCRIQTADNLNGGAYSGGKRPSSMLGATGEAGGTNSLFERGGGRLPVNSFKQPEGRWPANVLLDEEAAEQLDAQTRILTSRFFYVTKTSRKERELGCEQLQPKTSVETVNRDPDSAGARNPRAGAGRGAGTPMDHCIHCNMADGGQRRVSACIVNGTHEWKTVSLGAAVRNHHPTVKPIRLMRWLVRLVTPPSGTVLDPFAGSGSTGIAALLEGFNFLGMEQNEEYLPILHARLKAYRLYAALTDTVLPRKRKSLTR